MLNGIRQQFASPEAEPAMTDRELIERHACFVTIKSQEVEVHLVPLSGAAAVSSDVQPAAMITLPWAAPSFAAVKGILHAPAANAPMKPESRDALLSAIAKARSWIDDIKLGRLASFAEIAERENKGERHIRLLAPLALLSPRIIAAIACGTAPADCAVTYEGHAGVGACRRLREAEEQRQVGVDALSSSSWAARMPSQVLANLMSTRRRDTPAPS